jgi:aryl-alcohol dehydrogenase-like predicted oxidoreductase
MEYRALGQSGLRISVLTMGTMTFGGRGGFASVGSTDVDQARRQVDMCLEAGINLIDTADVYSGGLAEDIVGEVLKGRRDEVLVATKVRMPMGRGPNDAGLSRHYVISGCEASLRRRKASTTRSRSWSRSPSGTACPPPRWPWPTPWANRP